MRGKAMPASNLLGRTTSSTSLFLDASVNARGPVGNGYHAAAAASRRDGPMSIGATGVGMGPQIELPRSCVRQ